MIRRPPRSTRTDTLFPYTTRFRSAGQTDAAFTPGDLRRTVETRLAAVGIGQDVRARLQTHGLGGVQQRHYDRHDYRSEEHTSELQSLMRISYAVFCLKNKTTIYSQQPNP